MNDIQLRKQRILQAVHHLWSRLLVFFALVIVFAAVGLTLVKAATPLLAKNRQKVEHWLSSEIHYPVSFVSLSAGWHGFEPVIEFDQITIKTRTDRPLAHIRHFTIGFNLLHSLWSRQLRIGLIAIDGATLKVKTNAEGFTHIYADTNIPLAELSNTREGKGSLLKNLFLINKISIQNVKLVWKRFNGEVLKSSQLEIQMINKGGQHHIWGIAGANNTRAVQVAFVADFHGNIINKKTINGSVYIHGRNLNLIQWLPARSFKDFAITRGSLSGQSWTTISKGKVSKVQAELTVENPDLLNSTTGKSLSVTQLSADLAWEKQVMGWSLAVDGIDMQKDGISYRGESVYAGVQQQSQGMLYTGFIHSIPLEPANKLIAFFNYQPLISRLNSYRASGSLDNVFIQYASAVQFAASGSLNSVFVSDPERQLSLENLTGKFTLFPDTGEAEFNTQGLKINTGLIPKQILQFKNDDTDRLFWYLNANQLLIQAPSFEVNDSDLDIAGGGLAIVPLDSPLSSQLILNLQTGKFSLADLKNYFPDKPVHILEYLRRALLGGTAEASLKADGILNQFPWVNGVGGNFSGLVSVKNAVFLFNPDWPKIEKLNADVVLANAGISIAVHSGTIFNTPFTNLSAGIPNMVAKKRPNIFITGSINSTLQHAMDFIHHSPLEKKFGHKLEGLQFRGPMNLNLDLDIDLIKKSKDDIINGLITARDADVKIVDWNQDVSHVTGQLQFDGNSITSRHFTGEFLQQPIEASISTLDPKSNKTITEIDFAGTIAANYLKSKFPDKFIDTLEGAAKYSASLKFFEEKNKPNLLTITSGLEGLAIGLPEPFTKPADVKMPLKAVLSFSKSTPMLLTASLGDTVSFAANLTTKDNKNGFYAGNLHLGQDRAVQQKLPGLLIDGSLAMLDWDQWKGILNAKEKQRSDFSNIIRLITLGPVKLSFYGYSFPRTVVSATHAGQSWNLQFTGSSIAGTLNIPDSQQNPLSANLSRLYLNGISHSGTPAKIVQPADFPPLNIQVNDFKKDNTAFGSINFMATPIQNGIKINQVSAKSDIYDFNGSGSWTNNNGRSNSSLTGTLSAPSAARLLKNFTSTGSMDANDLFLKFNLTWPDTLFNPTLENLKGTVNLSTGQGLISNIGTKADSEIATGQLLTILSLQSLQKKLTLNFNDMTEKGYSFDSIKGEFSLANGVASTSDTDISGVVASIYLNGDIKIIQKQFDLYVQIIPHITSSAPIIATLAGGPVIGAATWLVNKLVSPGINQMAARYFHLAGPWSNPKITPLDAGNPGLKNKNPDFL